MLKPPEEHTTGSDEVPLGLVACCVGVEGPAAMYRREVSVCVDGHQRTQATGLPAIGCCFLFLSAATRHTDAWQRARVQAGSSTQSSDYRDAGSHTFSYESVPSSSCRSSCRRVPAGRIWGCHWTAIRRCGAPPMWFAACRSPWASCQQNWTWLSRASTREEKSLCTSEATAQWCLG